MQFEHEKHGAHQAADRYSRLAYEIAAGLPRGHGETARELRNAARGLLCYVAQGLAALGGPNVRFLIRAHDLAIRSVALVGSCSTVGAAEESIVTTCRTLLSEVVVEVARIVRSAAPETAATVPVAGPGEAVATPKASVPNDASKKARESLGGTRRPRDRKTPAAKTRDPEPAGDEGPESTGSVAAKGRSPRVADRARRRRDREPAVAGSEN